MTTNGSDGHLARTLRRVARDVFEQNTIRDLDAVLAGIVAAAVDLVPGAAGGGITRSEAGHTHSGHATDPTIRRLDRRQSETGEGPCVTAANECPEDGIVLADDLAGPDADRWPRFAPTVVAAGYRSMLSVHLPNQTGRPHSSLNLYGVEPHAFDQVARVTAAFFAVQASTLLCGADEAANLTRAVASRDVIGQAKGILMERFTVSGDEAFQMLVTSSQDTNMKLVEVARWLIGEAEARREERDTTTRTDPDRAGHPVLPSPHGVPE